MGYKTVLWNHFFRPRVLSAHKTNSQYFIFFWVSPPTAEEVSKSSHLNLHMIAKSRKIRCFWQLAHCEIESKAWYNNMKSKIEMFKWVVIQTSYYFTSPFSLSSATRAWSNAIRKPRRKIKSSRPAFIHHLAHPPIICALDFFSQSSKPTSSSLMPTPPMAGEPQTSRKLKSESVNIFFLWGGARARAR